ncbi:MAG: hypothetical protein GY861_22415 [bacterium]|nr:hypothetical protein [bacterium]
MITSISYDQSEILNNILLLHCKSARFDCDITYSKGNFYRNAPEPEIKMDINPTQALFSDVIQADSAHLPLCTSSLDSIVYDPPFLATTGPSLLKGKTGSNIIAKRFSVFRSEPELLLSYRDTIRECHRVLKPMGVLVMKCQDKISSGKQYLTHVHVIQMASYVGLYPKDMFVLLSRRRIVAKWQRNQQHARKYHAYFLVFIKQKPKVSYDVRQLFEEV